MNYRRRCYALKFDFSYCSPIIFAYLVRGKMNGMNSLSLCSRLSPKNQGKREVRRYKELVLQPICVQREIFYLQARIDVDRMSHVISASKKAAWRRTDVLFPFSRLLCQPNLSASASYHLACFFVAAQFGCVSSSKHYIAELHFFCLQSCDQSTKTK